MIFKHRDGEFRLSDNTGGTGPVYIEVLFTNADLTFPIERPRGEEMMNMNRGLFDSDASYSQGSDEAILEPLAVSISTRLDDTTNTSYLRQWLSGSSGITINNKVLYNTKGTSSVTNGAGTLVSTPAFADSTKATYNIEVLWDGTVDLGYKLSEVFFPPDQQTISEGDDAVTLNLNGMIYGAITQIAAFTGGTTVQT